MEAQVTLAASKLGYSSLCEEQMKAISSFAYGNDVFVSLPTGFGKTLCYSVLPVLFDLLRDHSVPTSIVVVVSPLVALMQDQVSSVEKQDLSAVYLSEHVDVNYNNYLNSIKTDSMHAFRQTLPLSCEGARLARLGFTLCITRIATKIDLVVKSILGPGIVRDIIHVV